MSTTAEDIRARIEGAPELAPVAVCDVGGEGPCSSGGGGGKFTLLVVSPRFAGVALLERHRLVQGVLAVEMKGLHALTIKALTPDVYETRKAAGTL